MGRGKFLIVCLLEFSGLCHCEDINMTEYRKMPTVFELEEYEDCVFPPDGLYCTLDFNLTTEKPTELWYQIKNFTANTLRHFQHDVLRRGVCVTASCNVTGEEARHLRHDPDSLKRVLENCVSEKVHRRYGFRGFVTKVNSCVHAENYVDIHLYDWLFVALVLLIVMLNVISSIYQVVGNFNGETKSLNPWLISFSAVVNWQKLMKRQENRDERLRTLAGIQGMRFLTMVAVIFSHILLAFNMAYIRNTEYIERTFDQILMLLLLNGNIVIQTFFCISSFLMAYNFFIYIEKHKKFSIWLYPLSIIQRWVRLTPVNVVIMWFVASWAERLGSGPVWHDLVGIEADSCRRLWWTNLFYINNIVGEGFKCLPQSWYLAVDSQLFCMGMIVMMIIWKFPQSMRPLLALLLVASIFLPGVLTYLNSYYPVQRTSPEVIRNSYVGDPTFTYIYSAWQGNSSAYVIGIIAAYIQYTMDQNNFKLSEKRWFRGCGYLFPLGLLVAIFSARPFFLEGYKYDPLIAGIYAALHKPLFASMVACMIVLLASNCGGIVKVCLEWDPFQVVGKLTYCALLVHPIIQRSLVGLSRHSNELTDFYVVSLFAGSITLTYVLAIPLCVLVEIPFHNVQKLIFQNGKKDEGEKNKPSRNGSITSSIVQDPSIEMTLKTENISRL